MATTYKILDESSLGAGASTSLSDNLQTTKLTDKAHTCVFLAEASGGASCTNDVRIHFRGSIDDSDYSTVDVGHVQTGYMDIPVSDDAGNIVRAISAIDFAYPYFKVIAENLDATYSASDVVVKTSMKIQDVK